MPLAISPSTEARLARQAQTEGVPVAELADRILNAGLDWAELPNEDDVAAIQEGFRAYEEGRTRPFTEFAAEHKARYHTR